MKYFRMSFDEIMYERSYKNLMLLNAAIPSLVTDEEDDKRHKKKEPIRHANQIFDALI